MGLVLIDKESIEPGNLVRHEALAFQVEQNKASSISVLHPTLRVVTLGYSSDVVNDWHDVAGHLADCDLVVDATGDAGVNEFLSTRPELADKIVAWCYVKPGPDFGVIVLRQPGSLLTLAEAESHLQEAVDAEVWAQFEGQLSDPNRLVWPEPGCYYPTFDAPYHRMRMMSDSFLTTILSYIGAREAGNVATLFCQYVPDRRLGLENRIEAQIRIQ